MLKQTLNTAATHVAHITTEATGGHTTATATDHTDTDGHHTGMDVVTKDTDHTVVVAAANANHTATLAVELSIIHK